jgi:short-subunit dehydrogenase
MLPEQSLCENDLLLCRDTLEVNAVSPALFAEAFAGHFAQAGRGTIAIIGSVAGDRGRKANYTYGACKGLVARYAEGLEHRFAGTGVSVVLIKPGPTDTPMAAAHRASGRRLASVEEVARAMVRGIDAKRPVVYAPAHWALIMFVVRHLPRFVFNRLDL